MKRSGVTILEVLFAIGIVTIGILGTMATLVVAGRQAADAVSMDGADRVGRNAIREFQVRSMNVARGPRGTWSIPFTATVKPYVDAVPVAGRAYCLDPLYVAQHGTGTPHRWFPAFSPGAVPGARMHRASLRPVPGDQQMLPLLPIGTAMASSIFVARDDMAFDLPDDRTLPPVQTWDRDSLGNAENRSYSGAFSWFATIQADHVGLDYANVDFVVCHRRDLSEPERLLDVTTIDGDAIRVAARGGQPDTDLELRERSWIMLAGTDSNGVERFSWQRVLNLRDPLPAGVVDYDGQVFPVTTRWVSVAGREWDISPSDTRVAVVSGVVAVYEKTIRMGE